VDVRGGCYLKRVPALADGLLSLPQVEDRDGRLRRAHDQLREAVRQAEGRERDPSAAVLDSQVVKTTPG
jgi:hypothetical protein